MKILPVYSYACKNDYNMSATKTVSFQAKNPIPLENFNELRVFMHHIYEYKKGLRSLILTTEKKSNRQYIEERLKKDKIPYLIEPVSEQSNSINVFFGNNDCIEVVKTFQKPLSKLSDEQDFMLGIMLGYDKILQCQRYLKRLAIRLNPNKG